MLALRLEDPTPPPVDSLSRADVRALAEEFETQAAALGETFSRFEQACLDVGARLGEAVPGLENLATMFDALSGALESGGIVKACVDLATTSADLTQAAGDLTDAIHLASQPDVIMTSFGDMMRVPGSGGSFFDANAEGTNIRMVYSPLDSLKIARQNPDKRVVFMAIGFETTAPSTAMTMIRAAAEGLANFSVFANHVTIIPAIKAILDSPDLRLDGFIGPGHVSTVIGCRPYEFIAAEYGKPVVVAGFEPLDILQSIYMLMVQLSQGRSEVENQYSRVVPWDGNPVALAAIGETMELRPYFEWRGLGFISHSALKVREKYAAMDAELLFQVPGVRVADPKACQCGEVLKGVLKPWECKVFGTACTPETPIGTCMVSPEGACAAYYNYGRMNRHRVAEAQVSHS